MEKRFVIALIAVCLVVPGIAFAANFSIDVRTMLNTYNLDNGQSSLDAGDPFVGSDRNGPGGNKNNGMADADEMLVIKKIIDDPTNPHNAQVEAAFTTNFNAIYGLITTSPDWVTTIANAWPGGSAQTFSEFMAGFATLGDADSVAWARQQLATYPVQLGFTTVAAVDANIATWDTSLAGLLAYNGDLDGDGQTNAQEYENALNTLSPDLVTKVLDNVGGKDLSPAELSELYAGYDTYLTSIGVALVPPFIDSDGDGLADSVETDTGTFVNSTDTGTDPNNPDTDGDGYSDWVEVALYPLLDPNVADSSGQVPVASTFGLALVGAGMALAGMRRLRKK